MAKNKKKENRKNSDLVYFFLVVPFLFVFLFIGYLFLNNFAEKNPRVCKYLGKLWMVEVATEDNPNPRRGCFTYEGLYE